jgi:ABC-type glycerol-3-phosphate transport system substrate-binding protein
VRYQRHASVSDKYYAWHLQGRGADVMRLPITDYHAMVAKGVIEPLDRFMDDPEIGLTPKERADFFPWIWSALEVDGHRHALPSDSAQYGLYYNRALFDAYNDEHPGDPVPYPSSDWTWDDLRRAAVALTVRDEDGEVVQYGLDFQLWSWPFMALFAQAGGQLWSEDGLTTCINSEAGVEALEFIVGLMREDAAIRPPEMVDSATGPDKLFALGRTAMLLDGSWRAPNLEMVNPDLEFAIAPLPHHRRRAVVTGSVLWAVSAHSQNKRNAWRMVKWLTSREQSMRYWDALRVAPPAQLSILDDPAFRETDGIVDGDGIVRVRPMPRERYEDRASWLRYAVTPDPETGRMPGFVAVNRYQADLEEKITRALSDVTRSRSVTAREALDAAAKAVHAIIDRDRAARGEPPVQRSSAAGG